MKLDKILDEHKKVKVRRPCFGDKVWAFDGADGWVERDGVREIGGDRDLAGYQWREHLNADDWEIVE